HGEGGPRTQQVLVPPARQARHPRWPPGLRPVSRVPEWPLRVRYTPGNAAGAPAGSRLAATRALFAPVPGWSARRHSAEYPECAGRDHPDHRVGGAVSGSYMKVYFTNIQFLEEQIFTIWK